MVRFDALFIALIVASALGIVSAQHHARKLFTELEREQVRTQALEVEWGQLQLEQSTWAAHARIERLVRERFKMHAPVAGQIVVLEPR